MLDALDYSFGGSHATHRRALRERGQRGQRQACANAYGEQSPRKLDHDATLHAFIYLLAEPLVIGVTGSASDLRAHVRPRSFGWIIQQTPWGGA